jgi:hypothetical protein
MAGGCEKVIAVGGGTRTIAGTGVELNKKGKAAAKNIGWADGAAEGKNWRAGPLLNKQTVFG